MDSAPASTTTALDLPLSELHGVGTERAALLARLEIHAIRDLLLHRPRRYEDRRHFKTIAELQLRELCYTCGTVVAMGSKTFAKRTKCVAEIILDDGTARLHCRWWNMEYMLKYFHVGDEVVACGKAMNVKPRTMDHPETEVVDSGSGLEGGAHIARVVPVYPLTEGLSQRWLRGLVWRTLQMPEIGKALDSMGTVVAPNGIHMGRGEAIRLLHLPESPEDGERARRSLAYEEFLEMQLRLRARRDNFEQRASALPCAGDNRMVRPFLRGLQFEPTAAQKRVLREIRADLGGKYPMRRLLQGDVGSGKTFVAFCAALMVIECGFSVALMAPTEILAEQHYRTASKWLLPLGIRIHLLTGSRKTIVGKLEEPALVIGTHALLESAFNPSKLGLVIIDEQHKFGVSQREELLRKGTYPHLLVMTATPIPRTLGLTLYGDLDSSVIDELPPGRGKIRTHVRHQDALAKVWDFVRGQLAAGRQAYIVYPRVEETAGNVKAVTKELERISKSLAPYRAAMLHGRMPSEEKEQVMAEFGSNRVGALLATSLIEVGVDVANATVMVIEDADQFGLAQLHQLRGRIGRGSQESHCILVSSGKDPVALERLRVLEQSSDGFAIAEADLIQRGPGEFLGKEQSGALRLLFADLATDLDLLEAARKAVKEKLNLTRHSA